jgi:hypothetical protein
VEEDGLCEENPSNNRDGEEQLEELDRRGRHAHHPRLPDLRQADRIQWDPGADMDSA